MIEKDRDLEVFVITCDGDNCSPNTFEGTDDFKETIMLAKEEEGWVVVKTEMGYNHYCAGCAKDLR